MIFLIARTRTLELNDHGSIFLQDLDLRTNPFEGREYGAILSRLKLKGLDPWYEIAKLLIKAWSNGQFHHLIGMIYEVLDREKRRTLGTALEQLQQSDGHTSLMEDALASQLNQSQDLWPNCRDNTFLHLFWRGKEKGS